MIGTPIGAPIIVNNVTTTIRNIDNYKRKELIITIRDKD